MGRRPNQVILQYFERGPKLADNSNRYPQTCKLCGETFPKGRIDSLTTHLTKRCPAITETDRINACLSLNGITGAGTRVQPQRNYGDMQSNGPPIDLPLMQQSNSWTALETLAEVSRQVDLNEKHDDRGQPQGQGQRPGTADGSSFNFGTPLSHGTDRFEFHEHYTVDNPPSLYHNDQHRDHHGDPTSSPARENGGMTTEEQMQTFLQSPTPTSGVDAPNLTVAAAATARLNTSLLDPQLLLGQDLARALQTFPSASTAEAPLEAPMEEPMEEPTEVAMEVAMEAPANLLMPTPMPKPEPAESPPLPPSPLVEQPVVETPVAAAPAVMLPAPPATPATPASHPQQNPQQPWGEITYMTTGPLHSTPASNSLVAIPASSARNVFRVDRNGPHNNGAKARHSRAKFDQDRRKEVQEVRKVGACIRCRILRKTCSVGSPCDTCRKVLSPRIWRSGCVRTKFTDQLDIYSAGVQIVQAQKDINQMKSSLHLSSTGTAVEACLFPDTARVITAEVLQGIKIQDPDDDATAENSAPWSTPQVVMIDNDKEDIPAKVEAYMREMLPEFVHRETSHFMRVTLDAAVQICQERNDELLRRALELWGLVEMMNRETSWTIILHPTTTDPQPRQIQSGSDNVAYRTICLQLTAAAERKAGTTSKLLLTGMQRILQDSKTKIDHAMFFTTLILLNCVEKSTWVFKAWEQDSLRANWPLEKPPSNFTGQGYVIADLLRMLLGIRRVLPKTAAREGDGILVVEDQDPVLQTYFQKLNLTVAEIQAKQQQSAFSPTDPRSFDLLFCSTLLLPSQGGQEGA